MSAEQEEVLAVLRPTLVRRGLALSMLLALAALLLYLGVSFPEGSLIWQVFLIATGLGALALAEAMRRATARGLELTGEELRDSTGEVLCRVADVRAVERGAFAFKPSNGFLIRLATPAARAWHPGLWWRLGRRIGVGGVTPGAQAKFMADMLAARLAERGGG